MSASPSHFSILDLFSIGIGPSSSHTVGPMKAAAEFAASLEDHQISEIRCDLFGSLADTGKGHGTGKAIVLGFLGHDPKTVPVDRVEAFLKEIRSSNSLTLASGQSVPFSEKEHVAFHRGKSLGTHTNAMHFSALDEDGEIVRDEVVYSIGGGFIVREGENLQMPGAFLFKNGRVLEAQKAASAADLPSVERLFGRMEEA